MTDLTTRLRELLAKATPGPWYARGSSGIGIIGVGLKPRHHPILQEVDGCGNRHDIDLASEAVNALRGLRGSKGSFVNGCRNVLTRCLPHLRGVSRWLCK